MALRPVPAGYTKIVFEGTFEVGTSRAALSPAVACDAIIVIPDSDNTGTIFWGGTAVTTASGIPVAGYPDGDIVPLNSTGKLNLISDEASQTVRIVALKG